MCGRVFGGSLLGIGVLGVGRTGGLSIRSECLSTLDGRHLGYIFSWDWFRSGFWAHALHTATFYAISWTGPMTHSLQKLGHTSDTNLTLDEMKRVLASLQASIQTSEDGVKRFMLTDCCMKS